MKNRNIIAASLVSSLFFAIMHASQPARPTQPLPDAAKLMEHLAKNNNFSNFISKLSICTKMNPLASRPIRDDVCLAPKLLSQALKTNYSYYAPQIQTVYEQLRSGKARNFPYTGDLAIVDIEDILYEELNDSRSTD